MLLEAFTRAIKEQCDAAVEYGLYGTRSFRIENIERLENKSGALNFLVTTWSEESEQPTQTKEMDLFEIMDLLGRVIGHRAVSHACIECDKNSQHHTGGSN